MPSRALAIGIPAGLAASAYLVNGLHGLAGWLDPFRFLSPFWLVGLAARRGVNVAGVLVVLAVGLAVLAAGSLLIERRDLQTPAERLHGRHRLHRPARDERDEDAAVGPVQRELDLSPRSSGLR